MRIVNHWIPFSKCMTLLWFNKIEFLKKAHEQDLEIKEIKLSKDDDTKYYLKIEKGSKLAKDISKLINEDKNEK